MIPAETIREMMAKVTRLEVIDQTEGGNGREYVKWDEKVQFEPVLQDDDKTLKIFVKDRDDWNPQIKPNECPIDGSCEACQ